MKTQIATMAALLAVLGAAQMTCGQVAPQASDYPDIKNFLRVDKHICTGGQPRLEDLEGLKAEGVRAIINLRQPTEYDADKEAAKARELGLRYITIPVDAAAPTDEEAEEFLKALAELHNHPAFIHCATANRVGAFWMIHRVLAEGWKLEDAEAEAKKIGMRSQTLVAFARSYIERHAKKSASSKSRR